MAIVNLSQHLTSGDLKWENYWEWEMVESTQFCLILAQTQVNVLDPRKKLNGKKVV